MPVVALGLALLATACGDGDEPPPTLRPIPGCEQLDLSPCDTLQQACQKSRFAIAACLRSTVASALPTVSVMTEQDYADYINAIYDGVEVKTNHFEIAMTWIGLAQPGTFEFVHAEPSSLSDWAGTYRWRQKDLLIINHGRPADDVASNVELVASSIRALRDRDTDIGAWTTRVSITDEDTRWGGDAMYFGEARFYSNRYKAALDGLDPGHFDELGQINAGIHSDIDWIRAQPSPFVGSNDRFADNFGARFAYLAWQRGGVNGVNGLYDSGLYTQQLMATETAEGPKPTLKYHTFPRAPGVWADFTSVTAVGAWGLFLALSRNLSVEQAWPLALDWRGDQIFVYKSIEPEDETALVWQLEMADEDSAASLVSELTAADGAARVQRSGTFVTLARATNDDSLDWSFVDQ
jgi:hypothetical protein